MATGLVSNLGISSSLTFTATKKCKLKINWHASGGGITVNALNQSSYTADKTHGELNYWLGPGDVLVIATVSTSTAVITVLEA